MLGQKGITLNVGDKVHFKSVSMIHPEATYEGVVTEVHPTYYRVYGTPIRSTMHENETSYWKAATPYYFCISKYLDSVTERFSVVDELTKTNTEIIMEHKPDLAEYLSSTEQMSA